MSPARLLRSLADDARFALRAYRRRPGFLLAALSALAIGLGGCAVITSIVEAVLLHPLDYPHADRVVLVRERNPGLGFSALPSSPARFLDDRRETRSIEHLAAYRQEDFVLLTGEEPARVTGSPVAGDFFAALGVAPELGTTFTTLPGKTEGRRVAVLGHELWQRRFGGDRSVVGREVRLDGELYTVVGVMPERFAFPTAAELWVPLDLDPAQWADRTGRYLRLVGRLAPGVSLRGAQAEMDLLSRRLGRTEDADRGWSSVVLSLEEQVTAPLRPALEMLLAAGYLLLAISCGNVANLLLARAAGRDLELATRTAFGAGRGRLLRQLVTESTVLTLAGGLLGLGLAAWADRLLVAATPELAPRWKAISLDPRTVAVTLLLALLCGLAAGLAPALRLARRDLRPRLSAAGRGTSVGWRRNRLVTGLAAAQLALSFVLLVGAGLLLHSFYRLLQVDPGFRAKNVLTLTLELPEATYPDGPARAAFFSRTLAELRALPGVERAGATSSLPLAGANNYVRFRVPGGRDEGTEPAPLVGVLPGYFETLGIPLVEGRTLVESDRAASPRVALVSRSLARQAWAAEDPVGQRILFGDGAPSETAEAAEAVEVVGVVGDVRGDRLEAAGGPVLYVPYDLAPGDTLSFCLRTSLDPETLVPAARRAIAGIDRQQPIGVVATLEEIVGGSTSDRRLALGVMSAFAATALLLAIVGIYGLLSHGVARGAREIGVRMALGAAPASIRRLVVGYAARVIGPGLAAGALAAWLGSRALASQLFGVGRSDGVTYLGVAALLTLLALAACWLPARRAARVDPTRALAAE